MPSLWNDVIIHVNQDNFLCCDPLISDSSYLPPHYLWRYKIEANTCLSKFIKHILVDNGTELLKTLAYTFDVGRAKVDSRFHKLLVKIQGRCYKVTLCKFSNTTKQKKPHSFRKMNFSKNHKVSLSFIDRFRKNYGKLKSVVDLLGRASLGRA